MPYRSMVQAVDYEPTPIAPAVQAEPVAQAPAPQPVDYEPTPIAAAEEEGPSFWERFTGGMADLRGALTPEPKPRDSYAAPSAPLGEMNVSQNMPEMFWTEPAELPPSRRRPPPEFRQLHEGPPLETDPYTVQLDKMNREEADIVRQAGEDVNPFIETAASGLQGQVMNAMGLFGEGYNNMRKASIYGMTPERTGLGKVAAGAGSIVAMVPELAAMTAGIPAPFVFGYGQMVGEVSDVIGDVKDEVDGESIALAAAMGLVAQYGPLPKSLKNMNLYRSGPLGEFAGSVGMGAKGEVVRRGVSSGAKRLGKIALKEAIKVGEFKGIEALAGHPVTLDDALVTYALFMVMNAPAAVNSTIAGYFESTLRDNGIRDPYTVNLANQYAFGKMSRADMVKNAATIRHFDSLGLNPEFADRIMSSISQGRPMDLNEREKILRSTAIDDIEQMAIKHGADPGIARELASYIAEGRRPVEIIKKLLTNEKSRKLFEDGLKKWFGPTPEGATDVPGKQAMGSPVRPRLPAGPELDALPGSPSRDRLQAGSPPKRLPLDMQYLREHAGDFPTRLDKTVALHEFLMQHGVPEAEAAKQVAQLSGVQLDAVFGVKKTLADQVAEDMIEEASAEDAKPQPKPEDIAKALEAMRKDLETAIEEDNAPTSPEGRSRALGSINNRGSQALVGNMVNYDGENVTVLGTHYDAGKDKKFVIVENKQKQLRWASEDDLRGYRENPAVLARQAKIFKADVESAREIKPKQYYQHLLGYQQSHDLSPEQDALQVARMVNLVEAFPEELGNMVPAPKNRDSFESGDVVEPEPKLNEGIAPPSDGQPPPPSINPEGDQGDDKGPGGGIPVIPEGPKPGRVPVSEEAQSGEGALSQSEWRALSSPKFDSHIEAIRDAIAKESPVSASAAKQYQIKKPKGWTTRGDLWVPPSEKRKAAQSKAAKKLNHMRQPAPESFELASWKEDNRYIRIPDRGDPLWTEFMDPDTGIPKHRRTNRQTAISWDEALGDAIRRELIPEGTTDISAIGRLFREPVKTMAQAEKEENQMWADREKEDVYQEMLDIVREGVMPPQSDVDRHPDVFDEILNDMDIDPDTLTPYPEEDLTPEEELDLEQEAEALESTRRPEEARGVESLAGDGVRAAVAEQDPAKRQQIKNSIAEGEMILKSGRKTNGDKMSEAELAMVKRSVDSARAKLGEMFGLGAVGDQFRLSQDVAPDNAGKAEAARKAAERAADLEKRQGDLFGPGNKRVDGDKPDKVVKGNLIPGNKLTDNGQPEPAVEDLVGAIENHTGPENDPDQVSRMQQLGQKVLPGIRLGNAEEVATMFLLYDQGEISDEEYGEFIDRMKSENRVTPPKVSDADREAMALFTQEIEDYGFRSEIQSVGNGPMEVSRAKWESVPEDVRTALGNVAANVIAADPPDLPGAIMMAISEELGLSKAEKFYPYLNQIMETGRQVLNGQGPKAGEAAGEKHGKGGSPGLPGGGDDEKPSGAPRPGSGKLSEKTSELSESERGRIIESFTTKHISDGTLKIYADGALKSDIPVRRIQEFIEDIDAMEQGYKVTKGLAEPVVKEGAPEGLPYPTKAKSFILGNGAGSGKTFLIASVIRDAKELQGKGGGDQQYRFLTSGNLRKVKDLYHQSTENKETLLIVAPDGHIMNTGGIDPGNRIPSHIKKRMDDLTPNGPEYWLLNKEGQVSREPLRVLWVTKNHNLIKQVKHDVGKPFGINDVTEFATYAGIRMGMMGEGGQFEPRDHYDIVIYDESQEIKNVAESKATALAGRKLAALADFSIYSSATPFENPKEVAYLADSGTFEHIPKEFFGWSEHFGVDWGQAGRNSGVFTGTVQQCLAAQQWLKDAGVLAARESELPENSVTASFMHAELSREQIDILNHIDRNFEEAIKSIKGASGNAQALMRAQLLLLKRRALESFKLPALFIDMEKELAKGQKILVMTATKSERDMEEKLAEKLQEMAEMRARGEEPSKFHIAYAQAHEGLNYKFLSPIEEAMKWAKDHGFIAGRYTGDVADNAADAILDLFRRNKMDIVVATMEKGGAGLSVHDTIGGHPISQHMLTLPWTGTDLEQAAHRAARYGMKSPVRLFYYASNDPVDQKIARLCGSRMAAMKAIVHGVESHPTAEEILAFNFGFTTNKKMSNKQKESEANLETMQEGQVFKASQPKISSTAQKLGVQDFAKEPGETKAGKKLVERIRGDKKGKVGMRSIVQFMMDELGLDFRVGQEQVSKKHPAYYDPLGHMVRSVSGVNSNYDFHEAGHGMFDMLDAKAKDWYGPFLQSLLSLTDRGVFDDSFASAPNATEGFAEWVRRYIKDPSSLDERIPQSAAIEKYLVENHPEIAGVLRDAARAYFQHIARDPIIQARSLTQDAKATRFAIEPGMLAAQAFSKVGTNWAIEDVIRQVEMEIRDNPVLAGEGAAALRRLKAWAAGIRQLREFRRKMFNTAKDMRTSHLSRLQVTEDIEDALEGEGLHLPDTNVMWEGNLNPRMNPEMIGLLEKVGIDLPKQGKHGSTVWLSKQSVKKIISQLPRGRLPGTHYSHIDAWEVYAYQKTELATHDAWAKSGKGGKYRYQYPGMSEFTPEDLSRMISDRERKYPIYLKVFKDLEHFQNQLLAVTLMSGEKSPAEVFRMRGYDLIERKDGAPMRLRERPDRIEHYMYLLRVPERAQAGKGKGGSSATPSSQMRARRGSQLPNAPVFDAMQKRIKDVLTAYHDNRTMLAPILMAREVANNQKYNRSVRNMAARIAVRLDPQMEPKLAATLDEKDEQVILNALVAALKKDFGIEVKPEDLNVAIAGRKIWRPGKPNAINIIAPFVPGAGRVYYQVDNPLLFEYFAHLNKPGDLARNINEVLVPATNAWKRTITGGIDYTARNLPRDVGRVISMSEHFEELIPGFTTVVGAIADLLGHPLSKISHPELLSKTHATQLSAESRVRRGTFMKLMTEYMQPFFGKNITGRQKAKRIYPNFMALALKFDHIFKFITIQTWVSQKVELWSRLGAGVIDKWHGASSEAARARMLRATGIFAEKPGSPDVAALLKNAGFANAQLQIKSQNMAKVTDPDPLVRARFAMNTMVRATYALAFAAVCAYLGGDAWLKRQRKRRTGDRARNADVLGYRVPLDSVVDSVVWNMAIDRMSESGRPAQEVAAQILMDAGNAAGFAIDLFGPLPKTMIELSLNKNTFTGKDIEPWWMKNMASYDAAYSDTPEAYRYLADKVDFVQPEGDSAIVSVFDKATQWRPLKIQHFVRSGLSRFYDDVARAADLAIRKESPRVLADVPVLGSIFTRNPTGRNTYQVEEIRDVADKYAKAKKKLEMLEATGKWGEASKLQRIKQDLEWARIAQAEIEDLANRAKQIQHDIDAERRSSSPDRAYIASLLRDHTEAETELAERAVELFQDRKK